MDSPVDFAVEASFAAQLTLRGEPIEYHDGTKREPAKFDAIRGRTQAVSEDVEGAKLEATTVDWLVDPADITIDGELVTPADDHYIVDARGRRYATVRIPGEKIFRPLEHDGIRIRIHTVEVEPSVEAPSDEE